MYRALTYGYLGGAGAENAFCGYVTPADAIQGWMNSEGHRANLLDPGSREIGLGYYRRASAGRGYVTQDFGSDPVYAPVIIENEALSTTTPNVNLYIYDRATNGGFAGLCCRRPDDGQQQRLFCERSLGAVCRQPGLDAHRRSGLGLRST